MMLFCVGGRFGEFFLHWKKRLVWRRERKRERAAFGGYMQGRGKQEGALEGEGGTRGIMMVI